MPAAPRKQTAVVRKAPAVARKANDQAAQTLLNSAIAQVSAIVALTAAWIYAMGAAVMVLRLKVALGLPANSVVSQLPREFLLTVGFGEVLLPAVVGATLFARWFWGSPNVRPAATASKLRSVMAWLSGGHRLPVRLAMTAVTALAVAGIGIGLAAFAGPLTTDQGLRRLLDTSGVVFLGLALSAHLISGLRKVRDEKRCAESVARVGIFTASIVGWSALFLAVAGNLSLPHTLVCGPQVDVHGYYIGSTSDSVYVVEVPADPRADNRIDVLPRASVTSLSVGSVTAHEACPTATR